MFYKSDGVTKTQNNQYYNLIKMFAVLYQAHEKTPLSRLDD